MNIEQLDRLHDLLKKGTITQDEFEQQKTKILNEVKPTSNNHLAILYIIAGMFIGMLLFFIFAVFCPDDEDIEIPRVYYSAY